MSDTAVCMWETGQTKPRQDHLDALCAALKVSHEVFYGKLPRAAG